MFYVTLHLVGDLCKLFVTAILMLTLMFDALDDDRVYKKTNEAYLGADTHYSYPSSLPGGPSTQDLWLQPH